MGRDLQHGGGQFVEHGSQTLMMDDERVVFDIKGRKRRSMTLSQLLDQFKTAASKNLEDDRMLLS